jgi:predicted outer membrane repeat protein
MRHSALICLALCLLALPAGARTYVITPAGTGDFGTIQAALNAVSDGDVIELINGTFTGPGNRDLDYLGKAVTVRSVSGNPINCVIDCTGSHAEAHRGFYFHYGATEATRLEGITIKNGYVPATTGNPWGGAILCYNASPTITNCVLEGNYAAQGGGGIRVTYGSPVISGCTIRGNRSAYGGGVLLWGDGTRLTDCRIEDNEATGDGAGIYCTTECTAELTGLVICGNHAGAVGKGGALVCSDCAPTISHCTLVGNEAYGGSGIWTLAGAQPVIDHTIIAFGVHASAFLCQTGGGASLTCCDVFGNEDGDFTACAQGQQGVDGNIGSDPLFCDRLGGDYTLHWTSLCSPVMNPECGLIGALPAACGAIVSPDGSGSYPTIQAAIDGASEGATIVLGEGVFSGPGNRDIDLQGKSLRIAGIVGATGTIIDCEGSEAEPHRGFIFDQSDTPETGIVGITITHACAPGPDRLGGAVRIVNSSPTLRDCIFTDNRARAGGAVSCEDTAFPMIVGCTFARNEADQGGAIIASNTSAPEVARCTFAENSATSPDVAGACIESASYSQVVVTTAILSFSPQGQAVRCTTAGSVTLTCSDIFGNAGGDWTDEIASQAALRWNFSADPLFCNIAQDDYGLWNNSPCIREVCGVIGAWPMGCETPSGIDADLPPASAGPALMHGSPNPFTGGATIRARAPENWRGQSLVADVVGIDGRWVRELAAPVQDPGAVDLFWDGRTSDGREAPAGVYLVRLRNGAERHALRVVLVR